MLCGVFGVIVGGSLGAFWRHLCVVLQDLGSKHGLNKLKNKCIDKNIHFLFFLCFFLVFFLVLLCFARFFSLVTLSSLDSAAPSAKHMTPYITPCLGRSM